MKIWVRNNCAFLALPWIVEVDKGIADDYWLDRESRSKCSQFEVDQGSSICGSCFWKQQHQRVVVANSFSLRQADDFPMSWNSGTVSLRWKDWRKIWKQKNQIVHKAKPLSYLQNCSFFLNPKTTQCWQSSYAAWAFIWTWMITISHVTFSFCLMF
jgi:hypothetical protein